MVRSKVLNHKHKKLQYKLFGKEPKTVNEVFEMVKVRVTRNALARDSDLVGLRFEIGYSNKIRATHSCVYTGYKPGFSGKIWLRLKNNISGFSSELLNETATWIGSGGGHDEPWRNIVEHYYQAPLHVKKTMTNPHCVGYTYSFYLDDFPDLKKEIEQQHIIARLKNVKFESYFQKTWISLNQLDQDCEFIELCNKTTNRRNLNLSYA